MALAMLSLLSGNKYKTFSTEIKWDAVMDKDEQSDAQTLSSVVSALSTALDSNIISIQSAVDFLAKYIDTMDTWENEKAKIEETRILNKPIEEGYSQQKQLSKIDDILNSGVEP